ncbi:hypothetical protein MWU61_10055 [Loktanella sp. F6476L]|uniref:hypothetical protein n=1 Tax=Loktanella sp. F6476L TaxID=2926405 RepID=UPI001FF1317E|nr:hypothetical protein [Loktanella sp. F6476L]MCK0120885.1 hypothetical protein [Loktanella sp. F6476L]
MKVPKLSVAQGVKSMVPSLAWPQLGRVVDVPVYIIHNSPEVEDYYFIFDFEEFVESSRRGVFVRPRIQVWAGRKDFSRSQFARQFRTSFAQEFEAARGALKAQNAEGNGWFSWLDAFDVFSNNLTNFAANVVLLVALNAGKLALSSLPLPKLFKGVPDGQKLEDEIAKTKTQVDAALSAMTISLHIDLLNHAFRHGGVKGIMDVDRDAWPLPDFVKRELN